MRPYIGIVGISKLLDAIWAGRMVQRVLCKAGYPLHVPQIGVQVSERSLRGERNQNRRVPALEDIPNIFDYALNGHEEIFTVIHFSPKSFVDIEGMVDLLFAKLDQVGPANVKGLQINRAMMRMGADQLKRIREKYPKLKLIIQMHKEYLTEYPVNVMMHAFSKVSEFGDYFLIDGSMGTGTLLSPQLCAFVAKNMLDFCPPSKLAFAGGLNGKTVAKALRGIYKKMGRHLDRPCFSIDAEGGLRDKLGDGYGNDEFNRKKAEAYFTEAVKTLQGLTFLGNPVK